ncbi:NifB/NifX family molybdenum-iron cluster-binding protein [Desulfonatronospira sp.]|uniref:NifB/NifX family molybdenum-iron cluster-binding protein n=1 Tax=Desulfonatronospira sp. TaxID=1962951 RepID=UPI0025B87E53|nr:NifB/NifX family molybdenum-iron cluster-binding protein [Desulfonatronospira sp.]
MIIAVSSQGKSLKDPIDLRFGRAAHFILYDTASDEYRALDNDNNLNAAQGAGIQAAQAVSRGKAEAVITGHCGPKAFSALQAGGIAVYLCKENTVEEAIQAYKKGRLEQAEEADRSAHW